jgi:hypothetical protein
MMPRQKIAVPAPAVYVSITIENAPDGDDIHVHADGQGGWATITRDAGSWIPALLTAGLNVRRMFMQSSPASTRSPDTSSDNGGRSVHRCASTVFFRAPSA